MSRKPIQPPVGGTRNSGRSPRRRGFARTWSELSWRQRGFVLASPTLLLLVDLSLRLRGYERSRRFVNSLPRWQAQPPKEPRLALRSRCFLLSAVAHRMPFRSDCLRQCLVLLAVARRWGVDATIRFGVEQSSADFSGHAWIEVDGTPVWPEDPALPHTKALSTAS